MDELETTLARAGRVGHDDPAVAETLHLMVDEARPAARPRRRLFAAVGVGAGLLLVGAPVAVAATVWGPWSFEPQLVVERSWTDVAGTPLGTCASQFATTDLPDDALATALAHLDELDSDSATPEPEWVAAGLNGAGRLDEIGRLVEGAQPGDFDVRHEGALIDRSDARIMQDAMMSSVRRSLSQAIFAAHPELSDDGIEMAQETQCTPAP